MSKILRPGVIIWPLARNSTEPPRRGFYGGHIVGYPDLNNFGKGINSTAGVLMHQMEQMNLTIPGEPDEDAFWESVRTYAEYRLRKVLPFTPKKE